ncbi:MAG: prepilin-type N-terminal cleavage/methylation domain-containing protein [Planctomycetes bacterium]|nr:prepilin-type N-terminal cleavage/methylation domain-containing protein [Planctomycetota bacterium]
MRGSLQIPWRHRRGFTLLELLVVIAILAVLLGIVISGIQVARKSALRAEKVNWLEQRRLGNAPPNRKLPISILFIGNSLTQNGDADLPQMLDSLVKSSGKKPGIEFEIVAVGGRTLLEHYNDGHALQRIRSRDWDFVVLQEQSARPYIPALQNEFYEGAQRFAKEIKARGAVPIFYMTWHRDNDPAKQPLLTKPFVYIASDQLAETCPAGLAMARCWQGSPSISLTYPSDYHPSTTGMYLIACTFFAWIYDVDPRGLPPLASVNGQVVVNLSAGQAVELQTYAKLACDDIKKLMRQKSLVN